MRTIITCRNPETLEEAMDILFQSGYGHATGSNGVFSNIRKQGVNIEQNVGKNRQQRNQTTLYHNPQFSQNRNFEPNFNLNYRPNSNRNSNFNPNSNFNHRQNFNPRPNFNNQRNVNHNQSQPEPMDVNMAHRINNQEQNSNQYPENFQSPASRGTYHI